MPQAIKFLAFSQENQPELKTFETLQSNHDPEALFVRREEDRDRRSLSAIYLCHIPVFS